MHKYLEIELEGIEVYKRHQDSSTMEQRISVMIEDLVGQGLLNNLTIAIMGMHDFRPQSRLWRNKGFGAMIWYTYFDCPQCDRKIFFHRRSEFLYGQDYGPLWYCHGCSARVGAHRRCNVPKGYPASGETLNWRRTVHKHFDSLWKDGSKTRSEAYKWLRERLDIPHWQCHIGKFDDERCKEALTTITGQKPLWPEF